MKYSSIQIECKNAMINAILSMREFSSIKFNLNNGLNERYLMNNSTWLIY